MLPRAWPPGKRQAVVPEWRFSSASEGCVPPKSAAHVKLPAWRAKSESTPESTAWSGAVAFELAGPNAGAAKRYRDQQRSRQ